MNDPNAQPAARRLFPSFPLLVGTGLWLAACLIAVRVAWLRENPGAALIFELFGAAPLALWAGLLWSGRVPCWGRGETLLAVGIAIGLRLILLASPPTQSDDIYRYLWEGRVQRAGENPYRLAPEAEELASLRDENWSRINHPEYTAIYPPLAQAAFLAVASVHPTLTGIKVFFTLCDVLTLLVLLRWLDRLGRSRAWSALWAFHPLVLVEFSGNGHVDSLMILMLVLALWSLEEGRDARASLALAGAIAAKLIPLLLLPYFFWKLRRRLWILVPPALAALAYLPYAGAGRRLGASLWIYQRDWLYNAPIFEFARDFLFGTDGWLARYWFYGALALIGAVLWSLKREPAAAGLPVLGFYQVAGPVVHPWYLCVFVALACVRRGGWPWLWLAAAAPLAYWGEERSEVRLALWGPFLAGLVFQAALELARSRKTGAGRRIGN